jgi:hypothetical protein
LQGSSRMSGVAVITRTKRPRTFEISRKYICLPSDLDPFNTRRNGVSKASGKTRNSHLAIEFDTERK